MSARDDYPLTARLGQATPGNRQREAAALLDEVDGLRAWKAEAIAVLGEWERVWDAAGSPGDLGESKAVAVRRRLERTP